MADPNVQACLEKLSAILGTSIVLGDATDPVSEDEEVKAISSYRKVTTPDDKKPEEQQGAPTPAEAAAEAEKEDAPVKFQLHDVGPRPRTDGAFDLEHFQPNEPTGEDMEFCPWKVVVDYPDHFVGNRNRPHVKPLFENIFADRTWDFFYIFDPTTVKDKPYFLVPTSQFQIFLDKVNKDLGVALSIPAGVNADRFLMKFGQDGTPRPRYIGRSEKDKPFNIEDWPSPGTEDAEAYQAASAIVQQDFLDKMKKMKLPPAKDRGAKAKTKAARKRADREHMLAEVQYLLGLKGWEGVTEMVFVSVDIEALERAPNLISEVGIAVLDAKDMRQVSPGDCGKDWWPLVKCYHFRTHEYSGLVNREYVQGCPDAFDFGESTFPAKKDLPGQILSILDTYIKEGREIALVGHDTQADINYLSIIGIELANIHRITRVLDSQALHQVWREGDQGRGLRVILHDLGIANKNLHNAGNDAVYTLRALVGIAMEELRKQAVKETGEEYKPVGWTRTIQEGA